jgi:hypothetical protein
MERKQKNAFVTSRKGFCYLTIKSVRQNHDMMRIRNYTLEAEDKRRMRRLYPDVIFDWKKIAQQLAEKREVCRRYRSRKRSSGTSRMEQVREPFYGVYDPSTRTVYVNDVGMGIPMLDAVLRLDPTLGLPPSRAPLAPGW